MPVIIDDVDGKHGVHGSSGNDTITSTSHGTGQIHIYADEGDDVINLDFDIQGVGNSEGDVSRIRDWWKGGHHVYGGSSDGASGGADVINFQNVHNVNGVTVGRIEDFDASRDTLQIDGVTLNLGSGSGRVNGFDWKVVEWDTNPTDGATGTQPWLVIDTNGGVIFYALEGARAVPDGQGGSNNSTQERHFISYEHLPKDANGVATEQAILDLPAVPYVDPVNRVPLGYSAEPGGLVINDYDQSPSDVNVVITGSSYGDVIAGGTNNDTIQSQGGNDTVWGGSGDDSILAGSGDDSIYGNTGNDVLNGGSGSDTLIGGTGADRFVIEAGDVGDVIADFTLGQDQIDIGAGAKTVLYSSHQDGVSLSVGGASFVVNGLSVSNVSSALFSNYGDQITVQEDTTPTFTTVEISADTNTYGTSGVSEIFEWVATTNAGARLRSFDVGEDLIDLSYWQASDFAALTFTAGTNFLILTDGEYAMRLYGYTDPTLLSADDFVFGGSGGGGDPTPTYTTVEISANTNTYGTSGAAESFQWVETSAAGARLRGFDVGEDVIDLSYWDASDFSALTFSAGANFLYVTDGLSAMRVYGYTDPAALGADDFVFGSTGGGGDPQPGVPVTVEISAETNTYGTDGVEEIFEWVDTSAAGARLRNVDSTEDAIDLTYWQANSVSDLSFKAGSNFLYVSDGSNAMRIYGYTDTTEFGADFFIFG